MINFKFYMLEFDQNILSQYPLTKKHLLISKQQEDKEKKILFKDEMWSQNKMQKGKNP